MRSLSDLQGSPTMDPQHATREHTQGMDTHSCYEGKGATASVAQIPNKFRLETALIE